MALAFQPPSAPEAEIAGRAERFPIRRIYCVGRNYAAHAREMGMDDRDPPFFFTKFPDAVAASGSVIAYPPRTADLHYEGELVIAIGSSTRDVSPAVALTHVFGYAAGLDMTRRDLQFIARDKGRPWDMGKNFSQAAVLAPIRPAAEVPDIGAATLTLAVNGEVRQQSGIDLMIWSCAEIIAELSSYDGLEAGDLIYTGTPAGVGPVVVGDRITLGIDGLPDLAVTIG